MVAFEIHKNLVYLQQKEMIARSLTDEICDVGNLRAQVIAFMRAVAQ